MASDRERMAADLRALGLYATSNDVRSGRLTLAEGVAHVRDYCLSVLFDQIRARRAHIAKYPPTPGTIGASMLPGMEERRDRLRAFLGDWSSHGFESGGGEAS